MRWGRGERRDDEPISPMALGLWMVVWFVMLGMGVLLAVNLAS